MQQSPDADMLALGDVDIDVVHAENPVRAGQEAARFQRRRVLRRDVPEGIGDAYAPDAFRIVTPVAYAEPS